MATDGKWMCSRCGVFNAFQTPCMKCGKMPGSKRLSQLRNTQPIMEIFGDRDEPLTPNPRRDISVAWHRIASARRHPTLR